MRFFPFARILSRAAIGVAFTTGTALAASAALPSSGDDAASWAGVLHTRVAAMPILAHVAGSTDIVFRDGFDGDHCTGDQTRSCYGGLDGTAGVGTCSAGTQYCIDQRFGACTGQLTPGAESCNGRDDNCDGNVDNGLGTVTCGIGACQQSVAACSGGTPGVCTPVASTAEICDGIDNDCDGAIDEDGCNCVHVAKTGLDTNPGTAANPMLTINAAITRAATSGPNIVCVGADFSCLGTANYDEAVLMHNGVHVYGGYQPIGTQWPRMPSCLTRIRGQNPLGVYFDASIVDPTILDGFTIEAQTSGTTTAAVTVQGSSGAVIDNNVISGGAATTSYGINVIDDAGTAAKPTITRNLVTGGNGTALAVGIRALNSAPIVRANCAITDAAGHCTATCTATNRSIRARTLAGTGMESDGIRLESSPGAVIDQNAVCTAATSSADAAAIRISGDASGTVIRGNRIEGYNGGQNALGVWAEPCAGAAPWIVNNSLISARSGTNGANVDGVRAIGDCHPRIDSNVRITGSAEGSPSVNANAIRCDKDAESGVSSRCTILGNAEILGAAAGTVATSTGIRCDDGACALIQDNAVISGRQSANSTGVSLGDTDTLVDSNVIESGCATSIGTGLLSDNSHARVQNNQISGVTGNCLTPVTTSVAVEVLVGNGSNEIDLHSNDVFAGEAILGTCTGIGIAFDLSVQTPPGARGLVRNNIVLAGGCSPNFDIAELDAAADPRIVQNNDLWKNSSTPTALYRDEASVDVVTIADVNLLSDIVVGANISADPSLSPEGHIAANSVCRNTGTADGGPLYDFDGDARPQEAAFDIGRDEYHP